MDEPRDRSGVDPGPEQEQVDQPNQNTQNDQPDPLESFYQLTDNDRAAINALPSELKDSAITALNNARVSQETEFQRRLAGQQEELSRGRKAQDDYNAITSDPKFQAWVMNEYGNTPPAVPNKDEVNYSQYGEQGEQFFKDMGSIVEKGVAPLREEVNALRSGFAQTQQEKNWAALETYTKDNGLPDPNNYKSQISMLQQRNGLTIDQAYRASVDLSTLAMRTPVNDLGKPTADPNPENPDTQNKPNIPPGTELPGTNRGSTAPRYETQDKALSGRERVLAAVKRRAEQGPPNENENWEQALEAAMKNMSQERGITVTKDDLE